MKRIVMAATMLLLDAQVAFGMEKPLALDNQLLEALWVASQRNEPVADVQKIKQLLDQGADVNVEGLLKGQLHINPLFLACISDYNNVALVRLLLDYGADINHNTLLLGTPLQVAIDEGALEVVKELLTFISPKDRQSIWKKKDAYFNYLMATKKIAATPMPKDIRKMLWAEVVNLLVDEQMAKVLKRDRVLGGSKNIQTIRDRALMHKKRASDTYKPIQANQFEQIAQWLDLNNTEETIRKKVTKDIEDILAMKEEPQIPQPTPQPWYSRMWNSVKQTVTNYWHYMVGGAVVSVGAYKVWERMKK